MAKEVTNDLASLDEEIAALMKKREEVAASKKKGDIDRIAAIVSEGAITWVDVMAHIRSTGISLTELVPGAARAKKQIVRNPGTPKYYLDGKPVDGRAARREPGFEKVRKDGKMNDEQAMKAGMINPQWISEQPERVLTAMKLDPAAYYKKFKYADPKKKEEPATA